MIANIKIPDGWRLLQAGEIPIKGDRELCFGSMVWVLSNSPECYTCGQGIVSISVVPEKYTLDSGYMMIRKIKVIRKKRKAKK